MAKSEITMSINPADMLTAHALEVIDRQAKCKWCHDKDGKPIDGEDFWNEHVPGISEYEFGDILFDYNFCPACGRKLE